MTFNMIGVLPEVEARDIAICCCNSDGDCTDICGVPLFHCSSLGVCICGKLATSQDPIAEVFKITN